MCKKVASDLMNVSVIMATYNGEKYIAEQLQSIVSQLKEEDELIISDDGSTDRTVEFASEFAKVRIVYGNHTGIADNFTNALSYAKNQIVLFSDQDDIWLEGKIEKLREYFIQNQGVKVVMHNAGYIDGDGNVTPSDIFHKRKSKHGFFRNILYSTYYGCCMGVRRDYLLSLIPVPKDVMYDQYIGACAEIDKVAAFIDEKLIKHRYHSDNWSGRQRGAKQIKIRMKLLLAVLRRQSK